MSRAETVKKITNCAWCESELSEEECENPYTDEDGDPICDECYHDKYEFECCLCLEYDHVNVQHYYLVVKVPNLGCGGEEIAPGIYYIKRGPYHGGSLIGRKYLFKHNLLRLRDLPNGSDLQDDFYPVGHLCRSCVDGLGLPKTKEYIEQCKKV